MDDFASAFPELLQRSFRVAHRILADETLAEDAATEALARAHASWSKVGRLAHRDVWISRAAAEAAIDQTPTDAAVQIAFVTAMRSLPRRQRDVLILHRIEGFTESEVAACLGVSLPAVKTTATLAEESLRELLGDGWRSVVGTG